LPKPLPALDSVHTVVLDFDGVLTDNKVWVDQDGRESVRCDRGDGLAFDIVRAFQKRGTLRATFMIVSKEPNPVVLARAKKLKIECHHGVSDKLGFIRDYLSKQYPALSEPFAGVVYLGNDLNDLPLMRRSGFAVAPADAHPRVKEISHLVLEQRGGDGFFRAFIERLLGINELTGEQLDELISDR
jgi:YrbI family 3-deoxy-D-manno-octulosonate 8-phosphate phosphatase